MLYFIMERNFKILPMIVKRLFGDKAVSSASDRRFVQQIQCKLSKSFSFGDKGLFFVNRLQ